MAQDKQTKKNEKIEKIISLCKRRGYIFPGSEIYGGLANSWDFGPLGIELKNNIKKEWWRSIIWTRNDVVGLDSAILMNAKIWEASGHVSGFSDPLVECKNCHVRFRNDYLLEGKYGVFQKKDEKSFCPLCKGELTVPKNFNLMLKTYLGPVEEQANLIYLRPETAQGIFVNFKQVVNTSRKKIPFGIAQIGKSFRNEITPGNFIFRTREFEQMELEYFVKPGEDEKWHDYWVKERLNWYLSLGIKKENLQERKHLKNELAHYAKACSDIEYRFSFSEEDEWAELEGIANRSDYDLKTHQNYSGKDLTYFDEKMNENYFPYVIEPSAGVDRSVLAFLLDAYFEENITQDDQRVVLKLHPRLSPFKLAVLPLLKNDEQLVKLAKEVYQELSMDFVCDYDETGSIGRRYRRQDEVGTFGCVTIDHQSLQDKTITIRHRDTMKQERFSIKEIKSWLEQSMK